jgi:hypothetical protein
VEDVFLSRELQASAASAAPNAVRTWVAPISAVTASRRSRRLAPFEAASGVPMLRDDMGGDSVGEDANDNEGLSGRGAAGGVGEGRRYATGIETAAGAWSLCERSGGRGMRGSVRASLG